ncbi:MAG: hypothetical protein JHD21_20510, partial [Nocardioides sp.]|nr:hypothetical protein [Nocardioides sp.]
MADEQHGVVFPSDASGGRSTSALGRVVVGDALRAVDPVGARAAERETAWRSEYLGHFKRLVEAGLGSREDAVGIARAGLDSLHGRMQVRGSDEEGSLAEWPGGVEAFGEVEVTGTADPLDELVLPYRGDLLRGDAIRRQVDTWVEAGIVEPTVADAVDAVLANPDWLRLDGHTVAVIGAASEMGPLRALTRWGARVAAVDLPRPDLWERVLD